MTKQYLLIDYEPSSALSVLHKPEHRFTPQSTQYSGYPGTKIDQTCVANLVGAV